MHPWCGEYPLIHCEQPGSVTRFQCFHGTKNYGTNLPCLTKLLSSSHPLAHMVSHMAIWPEKVDRFRIFPQVTKITNTDPPEIDHDLVNHSWYRQNLNVIGTKKIDFRCHFLKKCKNLGNVGYFCCNMNLILNHILSQHHHNMAFLVPRNLGFPQRRRRTFVGHLIDHHASPSTEKTGRDDTDEIRGNVNMNISYKIDMKYKVNVKCI